MKDFNENNRLFYLDAVRAFALTLGIIFHASLSFFPVYIGWAVMDVSTTPLIGSFMTISHSFRMHLFFLIAGFFSHMAFHTKGGNVFFKSRLTRIAIPFVIGWFILRPLIVSGWIMGGESMRGEVNVMSGLKLGFLSLGELPTNLFVGTHLWFLYYLLLITTTALSVRFLIARSPQLQRILMRTIDTAIVWLTGSNLGKIALAVPTAFCLWQMDHWGMDTPDKSLMPHLSVFSIYSGFFFFGWLLQRSKPNISRFSKLSVSLFVQSFVTITTTILLSKHQSDAGHPQFVFIKLVFVFSYAIMMWNLVALAIGLFHRFFNKPNKVIRYLADASYWLYLVHLPIVLWLQIAFAELDLHWSIKLASIATITIGLSLILYDVFVRSSVLGKLLNGQRKTRRLFSK